MTSATSKRSQTSRAEDRPDTAGSVDDAEIAKFSAMAHDWWDPNGKFRPLHRQNPTRLAFIRDRTAARFGRDPLGKRPLAKLEVLDIGCGGGLLAEPLTRLGARVTGLDASHRNIEIARLHAAEGGLEIAYRHGTAEALAETGASYDLVLNMEVIEHVADVGAFMAAACALVRPGGAMIASTINRTAKAYMLAIVGAEYLLHWLPRGTHDWRKFLRPSELAGHLRAEGLTVEEVTGMAYNPLADSWRLAPRDIDVNYLVFATKD